MSEIENDKNDERIQEIMAELSECREDERCSQNQIIQVLSTAGVVLGVVFAFVDKTQDKLIMFILNDIVLSTTFAFIITLGIGNVLRYHYIQDLEDRLYALISCEEDKRELVHWMSFSSPILTRNPKHLNSKYSRLNFFCYTLSIVSAIIFCIFIMYYQYKWTDTESFLNRVICIFPAIFMLMSIFLFFYICIKAKDMYCYALTNSIMKRKKRMEGSTYMKKSRIAFSRYDRKTEDNSSKSIAYHDKDWFKVVVYFIYPKVKDIQKSSLILVGFIIGIFLSNIKIDMLIIQEYGRRLFLTMIIIDFLLYQARYQWNDIRGLREDMGMNKTDRLPAYALGKWPAVIVSLIILFVKIFIAFFVLIRFGGEIKIPLFICTVLLIFISILYEAVRTKRDNYGVFLIVGLGYPLRIITGIWSSYPEMCHNNLRKLIQLCESVWEVISHTWHNVINNSDMQMLQLLIIFLLISFFFYGEFSVTIAWTYEALQLNKNKKQLKSHYQYLLEKIQNGKELPNIQDPFEPLRKKGKLSAPWNICYLLAMASLPAGFAIFILRRNLWYDICELLVIILSALLCKVDSKQSIYIMISVLGMIIGKTVIYFYFCDVSIWVMCIGIFQIVYLVSYYTLRYFYDPNFHAPKLLFKTVIGKDTFEYLEEN